MRAQVLRTVNHLVMVLLGQAFTAMRTQFRFTRLRRSWRKSRPFTDCLARVNARLGELHRGLRDDEAQKMALPRERDSSLNIKANTASLGEHDPIDLQGFFISQPKPNRRSSRFGVLLPLVATFAMAASPAAAQDVGAAIGAFFFTVFLVIAIIGGLLGTIYFAGEAHNARRALEKRRTSPEHYAEETMRMRAIAGHLHAQTDLDEAKLRRALKQEELNEVESVLRKGSTRIGQSSKR